VLLQTASFLSYLLLFLRGVVHALQSKSALLLVAAVIVIQLLPVEQVLHEGLAQCLCILLCIQRCHVAAEPALRLRCVCCTAN
jgi:hypothetical protein